MMVSRLQMQDFLKIYNKVVIYKLIQVNKFHRFRCMHKTEQKLIHYKSN